MLVHLNTLWITILGLAGLLIIAVLALSLAKRYRFPYTILLAVIGFSLGLIEMVMADGVAVFMMSDFLTGLRQLEITSEMILFVFLPVIIFESALCIDARRLMADLRPILLLAVVGVVISTLIVGYSLWWVSGMGILICLLLGAITAATDPVAVIALFKELSAPKRLTLLVEGESLFNDATAIVLFTVITAMILGESEASLTSGVLVFFKMFLGGVVVGYAFSWLMVSLVFYLALPAIATFTLSIAWAYLSFILAEHYLHVSGVMAVVTSGLVTTGYLKANHSPEHWKKIKDSWSDFSFWANSIIFILVGMLASKILVNASSQAWLWLLVLIFVATIARAFIVYLLLPLVNSKEPINRVSMPYKTVMFWGGLRGAVALALALVVMEGDGFSDESQAFIGVLVTGFVFFTLLVNATTTGWLMRRLGLAGLSATEKIIRDKARLRSLQNITSTMAAVIESQDMQPHAVSQFESGYKKSINELEQSLQHAEHTESETWLKLALTELSNRERKAYLRSMAEGFLEPKTMRLLVNRLDERNELIKDYGLKGYEKATARVLAFSSSFKLALHIQRATGSTWLLAKEIRQRFQFLLATKMVMRSLLEYEFSEVVNFVGQAYEAELKAYFMARLQQTEKALASLELQYPAYGVKLYQQFLNWVAVQMERQELQQMIDDDLVRSSVLAETQTLVEERAKYLSEKIELDMHLDSISLIAKVPFLKDLPDQYHQKLSQQLKSKFYAPDEVIFNKHESGDVMYFISSGSVRVQLDNSEVELGTGDFFGEIALIKHQSRMATVVSTSYSELLMLSAKDFRSFVTNNPDIRDLIYDVADERLES